MGGNTPSSFWPNPVKGKYDPKKPTFVQLYDERLASDKQLKENKPFTSYEKDLANHYEISSYDDAVIPYYFEVDPNELSKNIKK